MVVMNDARTDRRPASVAGSFYPASPEALRAVVRRHLARARASEGPAPKVLLAPHAGYAYSGAIAGSAYARVAPLRGRVTRVVIVGPAHRVRLRGLALPSAARFATPLGDLEVDHAAAQAILTLPQVVESDAAHAAEHAIEVQLPFLQEVLGSFSLVPLVVGDASPDEVGAVLERLWGGDETLLVVSSDLSHYLPYAEARRVDARTVADIVALGSHVAPDRACGAAPLNGVLRLAARRGLRAELLDLRSSGDTEGDREQVVGYAAVAFFEPGARAAVGEGDVLLAHARAAIEAALGAAPAAAPDADFLRAPGATFVTLKTDGELRGCIGSVSARRPVGEDVRENAVAAALEDPRFPPLRRSELPALRVEVSRLSPSTPLEFTDEDDLCARLHPGVDGLTLELGDRRATFLPQVWEQVHDPRDFVRRLKMKMGLPGAYWSPAMRASRYTVEKFSEEAAP